MWRKLFWVYYQREVSSCVVHKVFLVNKGWAFLPLKIGALFRPHRKPATTYNTRIKQIMKYQEEDKEDKEEEKNMKCIYIK